jgi:hypothetical protein
VRTTLCPTFSWICSRGFKALQDRFMCLQTGPIDPPMFDLKANTGTVFAAQDAVTVN